MTNQTETTIKKLPTHDVFVDIYSRGNPEPKTHKISVGWENKDGKGINILINGTLYVIRENKNPPDADSPDRPTHSVFLVGSGRFQEESQWYRIGPGWIQDDSNIIGIILNGTYYTIRKRKRMS